MLLRNFELKIMDVALKPTKVCVVGAPQYCVSNWVVSYPGLGISFLIGSDAGFQGARDE